MNITITERKVDLDSSDKAYAKRRVGFALGRFSNRLGRVTLTLGDTNGPQGGVDKFCRITVILKRGQPVVINTEATTIREAIDLTAERVKRAVSRNLARARPLRSGAARSLPDVWAS